MKSNLKYFFTVLCGVIISMACSSPEERATGKEGAGRTDSTMNSPPGTTEAPMDDANNYADSATGIQKTDSGDKK